MMMIMIWIFWISAALLFYHLFGYPLLMVLFTVGKKEKRVVVTEFPRITVLCPAFNEADVIEDKIRSFLAMDYPKDRIDMIVISDDSTDGTNEIVQKYKDTNVRLVVQKPRKGKVSGHNMIEPKLDCDYVVSTDANSIFHPQTMKELLSTMLADRKIGMVCGKLALESTDRTDSGEGLYWKYESWLKTLNSKLYSINCANGSLFMIKRELFGQLVKTSSDDLERTLITLERGYLAKFTDRAIVSEEPTDKPREEFKRKIRIISREWQTVMRNKVMLNPFKHPVMSWILFSHKILRWLFFLFVIGMAVSLTYITVDACLHGFTSLWQWLYALMALGLDLILTTGILEFYLESRGTSIRIFKPSAYFFTMFWASMLAFFRFIRGNTSATWSKVR